MWSCSKTSGSDSPQAAHRGLNVPSFSQRRWRRASRSVLGSGMSSFIGVSLALGSGRSGHDPVDLFEGLLFGRGKAVDDVRASLEDVASAALVSDRLAFEWKEY